MPIPHALLNLTYSYFSACYIQVYYSLHWVYQTGNCLKKRKKPAIRFKCKLAYTKKVIRYFQKASKETNEVYLNKIVQHFRHVSESF